MMDKRPMRASSRPSYPSIISSIRSISSGQASFTNASTPAR
eukprot:CAMPEP_0201891992 /NCGR_PEP_ID=MMETSP0902-20130614/35599_1 /ASSEMBLY_ACC=CAM_ASM_000551 /TAXON_ID=420261 /ORGANISM="Thalassiosira antarctica, Strain CCMP982" /LENGTH=40 /DNA_ID= /DNA_START= /DNA_END= /DNA_ORIENTATION=